MTQQAVSIAATLRMKLVLVLVLALTLMPWTAVWLGRYGLKSILWTFFLYHAVCLLPAVIWGYPL